MYWRRRSVSSVSLWLNPEFAIGEEFWYNSIGYPTQSMNGAGVFKAGADYSLESLGLGARTIGVAYTNFDLKDKYNANTNSDTSSWDVIYTCNGALLKILTPNLHTPQSTAKITLGIKAYLKRYLITTSNFSNHSCNDAPKASLSFL